VKSLIATQLPAAVEAGTGINTQLLIIAGLGIALLVVLIAKFKFHPFLALILGSGFVGLAAGVEPAKVIANFEDGVGGVLKEVGLLVALGAMLGKLLADSGGANRVVDTLLAKATGHKLVWSITLVAVIIGLPMFFEIGLVLLLPVIVLVTQRSKMPLIAISAVKAELGTTLALGILVAIPTVIICGPLFSRLAARWVPVGAPAVAGGVDTVHGADMEGVKRPPSFLVTLLTILFPVALMLLRAVVDIIWPNPLTAPAIRMFFDFVGQPLVAMTLAVLLAMVTFGYAVGLNGAKITGRISASLGPIAGILLIVGAGGGFKQTLIGAGVGDAVKTWAEGTNMSVLVLGFIVAVALRLATGSATVATVTAAGIVAPLASSLTPTHAALLALAIGAGSLFFSHVNDAGFWLVKELFGLTVGQTFKTWSVMETLISVVSFGLVMLLSLVI
jgi:gluconate:H+ symporter, GntP family